MIWDIHTYEKIKILKGHTGSVFKAAYSFDGKLIVSGSGDNSIILWDAIIGTKIK
jgi:WD40 repeat protein